MNPMDTVQNLNLKALQILCDALSARVSALEAVLKIDRDHEVTLGFPGSSVSIRKNGTIRITGHDIEIKSSGKAAIKASGEIVLKGSKVSEN